jgi:cob(I)alamin adenosyltransferase
VARTAIRRAERRVVALNDSEGLEPGPALRYLNRASDLVFAMARYSDESNPQLFEGRKGSADA